jgi:hypothetical protein
VRKQIITITVEGTMQGLQVKPGQGLDLRQFGDAKIVRASEIAWSEERQAWFVDVLQDAGKGPITFRQLVGALDRFADDDPDADLGIKLWLNRTAPKGWSGEGDEVLHFLDYNEAVKVEIAYLDGLRKQGVY